MSWPSSGGAPTDTPSCSSSTECDSQLSRLEPFLLLANTAKGLAASKLVLQTVEAPNVFVFGELLHHKSFSVDDQHRLLLEVFAYSTYDDYLALKEQLPLLSPSALHKLRLLTLATLAANCSEVSYEDVRKSLHLDSDMSVEAIVIEAISLGIVNGKLDQKEAKLLVSHAMARDVRKGHVSLIREKLEIWCRTCDSVLGNLQEQVDKANETRRNHLTATASLETRITEQRSRLRAQQQQSGESEDPDSSLRMETDQQHRSVEGRKEAKKTAKGKALRNGGNANKSFWKHN